MQCARANQHEFYWYAAEMATGGYTFSFASSGGDNASDNNCSEAIVVSTLVLAVMMNMMINLVIRLTKVTKSNQSPCAFSEY